jgi:hypothetical protein
MSWSVDLRSAAAAELLLLPACLQLADNRLGMRDK